MNTARMDIRLPKDEKAAILKAANRCRLHVSEYIRARCFGDIATKATMPAPKKRHAK